MSSDAPSEFLSCDWGTTSFRLRWLKTSGEEIRWETRCDTGVRTVYERASAHGHESPLARAAYFEAELTQHLDRFAAACAGFQSGLPLVISGMASSTVGWKELRYATLPFPLDGSGMVWERIPWQSPRWLGPTFILSGAANAADMMRGEETELMGLMNRSDWAIPEAGCWVILPGTHSKHVRVESGKVVGLRTFMTGELFEVLKRHSLLKATLPAHGIGSGQGDAPLTTEAEEQFLQGVDTACEFGVVAGLFRVRTRVVLGGAEVGLNDWFLSGLLIGGELMELDREGVGCVLLGGAGVLHRLYGLAFARLDLDEVRCVSFPEPVVRTAGSLGQAFLLRHGVLKR